MRDRAGRNYPRGSDAADAYSAGSCQIERSNLGEIGRGVIPPMARRRWRVLGRRTVEVGWARGGAGVDEVHLNALLRALEARKLHGRVRHGGVVDRVGGNHVVSTSRAPSGARARSSRRSVVGEKEGVRE
jgi:hypothetical protein